MLKYQTKAGFQKALSAKGIQVIFRQNDEGRIYGVTFIDQNNKAVFNGSDLGKAYSANLLSAKLQPESKTTAFQQSTDQTTSEAYTPISNNGNELLDILFAPEREDMAALNKFKKKKRKGLNL